MDFVEGGRGFRIYGGVGPPLSLGGCKRKLSL